MPEGVRVLGKPALDTHPPTSTTPSPHWNLERPWLPCRDGLERSVLTYVPRAGPQSHRHSSLFPLELRERGPGS